MQRSALCRSRRELSNEYLLAKFGFDTAENEPEYGYWISLIFVSLIFGPDLGQINNHANASFVSKPLLALVLNAISFETGILVIRLLTMSADNDILA